MHVLHAVPSPAQLGAAMITPDLAAAAMGPMPLPRYLPQQVERDTSRELQSFVETALAELDTRTSAGSSISWSAHVREAEPAAAIMDLATELGVDLIVVGTHGRRGLERLLLGSVAEAVVRRATCPVLVVPPARADPAPA